MKLLSILFLSFIFWQVKAYNNMSVPALERLVDLQCTNEKISTILESISKQTGVVFSYSQNTFSNSHINLSIRQKSVRYALNQLFSDKVTFTVKGKYIILKKAEVQANKPVKKKIIEGYITEPNTGKVISNATIFDATLMASAITDKYGYFKIELPDNQDSVQLHIRKEGYSETILKTSDKWQFLDVPVGKKLNDIVTALDSAGKRIQYNIPKWLISNEMEANTSNLPDTFTRKAQISLLPYVGTNSIFSGNYANDYSFNILAGYVYEVKKIELGGMVNIVRKNVSYIQVAGIGNIVGGETKGIQYGGTFNYTRTLNGFQSAGWFNVIRDRGTGIQSAGFSNFTWNNFNGVQAAGFLNFTGSLDGLQLAGIANIVYKKAKGFQAAGLANYSNDSIDGSQLSGFLNHSKNQTGSQLAGIINNSKNITGLQLASTVNVADTINGSQISSIYNQAKYVNGLQLAMFNFADSCKGIPIGFFSYVAKGYHKFEFSLDELYFTNVSFRTGVNKFHNNFAVGIRTDQLNQSPTWCYSYGFGSSFLLSKKNMLDIDISSVEIAKGDYTKFDNALYKIDIGLDHQLFRNTSIYAGISYNYNVIKKSNDANAQRVANMMPYTINNQEVNATTLLKSWIGAKIALRF
jgi:hypothetical protein